MTAVELRERRRNPEEEAAYFSSACKDKDGFDVKYINPDTDDSLGSLVNDDHVRPNSKMKTITVAGKPHLCLFATRSITPGEEITYNYGDSEWPWRCKNIAETDALVSANSVLAKKNQMQPEELLPQVPRDATHKVPEEGPFASPMMVTLPPVKEIAQIKSEADVLVTTIPLLTEKDQMQPEELLPQFSREATHENIAETDALVSANSVLAKKNQMQPEELLPQVPRDATHKVPEEGPFASPMMVTLPPVKERAQIKPEADVLVTTIPLLTEKDQMQPEELLPQFSREATHKSCFEKLKKDGRNWVSWGERNSRSDEDTSLSDEEYVPESDSESDSSLDLAVGYKNKAQVSEQKLKAVHSKFTKTCSSKLPLKHASKGNGKQYLKAREGTCLNEEADLFCHEEQLTDAESDVESDSSREWEDAPLREVQVKPVSNIKLSSEVAALGSRRNDFCLTRSVTVTPTKGELLEVRGSASEADFQDVPLTGQEDTWGCC
ncbi:hypothetical protein AOLI_G00244600 [Acnodon oligacanthus]